MLKRYQKFRDIFRNLKILQLYDLTHSCKTNSLCDIWSTQVTKMHNTSKYLQRENVSLSEVHALFVKVVSHFWATKFRWHEKPLLENVPILIVHL